MPTEIVELHAAEVLVEKVEVSAGLAARGGAPRWTGQELRAVEEEAVVGGQFGDPHRARAPLDRAPARHAPAVADDTVAARRAIGQRDRRFSAARAWDLDRDARVPS